MGGLSFGNKEDEDRKGRAPPLEISPAAHPVPRTDPVSRKAAPGGVDSTGNLTQHEAITRNTCSQACPLPGPMQKLQPSRSQR